MEKTRIRLVLLPRHYPRKKEIRSLGLEYQGRRLVQAANVLPLAVR